MTDQSSEDREFSTTGEPPEEPPPDPAREEAPPPPTPDQVEAAEEAAGTDEAPLSDTGAEAPPGSGLIFDREGTGPYAGQRPEAAPVDPERPWFDRGQPGPFVTGESQLGRREDAKEGEGEEESR